MNQPSVKSDKDYNAGEKKIFRFLSLQGTEAVIGTASLKEIDYAADYDLMEYVNYNRNCCVYELVLNLFREKFRTAYLSTTIWIIDFKCGVLPGGQPLRWTRESINDGYQIIEDKPYYFVDCLQQKSIIKLDVISSINKIFHEFSEMYFFHFDDFTTYESHVKRSDLIKTSLLIDVKYYQSMGQYYKALKRLFAYFRISNNKLIPLLIDFFNSNVGKLAAYNNDLEIILTMKTQSFRPVPKKEIMYNLKHVEKNIDASVRSLVTSIISSTNVQRSIEETILIINDTIQEKTKQFIASNKKIYSYIKV
jgi:hypothetical protein